MAKGGKSLPSHTQTLSHTDTNSFVIHSLVKWTSVGNFPSLTMLTLRYCQLFGRSVKINIDDIVV